MPKPIIITKALRKKVINDFSNMISSLRLFDGKIKYSRVFSYEDRRATVWYTQEAYRKVVTLVSEFGTEVGWHGTASRISDDEYEVDDIIVYPQEVTGSTVNTDQNDYTNWLMEHEDDIFNRIRAHGHSHCNMGVSPSGVDDKHRQSILDLMEGDMFYIFSIWNKSLKTYNLVYDFKSNLLYDDDEIDVKVRGYEGVEAFLLDAQQKVKPVDKAGRGIHQIKATQVAGATLRKTAAKYLYPTTEGGYPWES